MRLALLVLLLTSLTCSFSAHAADVGIDPKELIGEWTISGKSLGDGKYTVFLGEDGKVTAKVVAGNSSSSASGATWSYTEGRLSFEGSEKIADLKIGGTWVTDWTSADKILITVARGNQFTMKRVTSGKQPK